MGTSNVLRTKVEVEKEIECLNFDISYRDQEERYRINWNLLPFLQWSI